MKQKATQILILEVEIVEVETENTADSGYDRKEKWWKKARWIEGCGRRRQDGGNGW